MAVLIGHASISEKGTINGAKGDSTGKEVCTRTWYSKPWDFMAIHPNASVREKIASTCEDGCANNNIGYGQGDRNTLYTQAKSKNYDLSKITTKCNCDCSSFMNVCCVAAGVGSYGSNGWTTSTMKSNLKNAGFVIITDSTYLKSANYCVRGAIYVKSNSHTVCGLSNGSNYKKTLSKMGSASDVSNGSSISSGTSSSSKLTLKVDGKWGTSTTKRLQQIFGTIQDGKISNQRIAYKQPGCYTGWEWKKNPSGYSALIKAIQRKVGVTADGWIGPNTIKAMQKYWGTVQDGKISAVSDLVKALQRWCNNQ